MPIRVGKGKSGKTYKNFGTHKAAVKRKHPGWSDKRAAAYTAKVEMLATGKHPRTGKPVRTRRKKK